MSEWGGVIFLAVVLGLIGSYALWARFRYKDQDQLQPADQCNLFVQQVLPSVIFEQGPEALAVLNGPDALRYATGIWRQAGPWDPDPAFDVQVQWPRPRTMVTLFRFPQPRQTGSPWFVALVATVGDGANALQQLETIQFFVLEHSDYQGKRTMLIELVPGEGRVNLGEGPPPEIGAFVQAVTTSVM